MSATNSTTNYGLPIFLSQDVPSWLTDWNSAMSDIDTAIAAAKTAADGAQLTASNAQAAATQNAGAITQLQTTVGSLSGNVTSLSGAVNTINSLIGNGTPTTTDHTLIGAINELHADQGDLADLQTTDKSSLVAAINEAAQGGGSTPAAADVTYSNTTSGLTANNVQAAIDELAAAPAGFPCPNYGHRNTVVSQLAVGSTETAVWTATEDCFVTIVVEHTGTGRCAIQLNGEFFVGAYPGNTWYILPVKSGDVITASHNGTSSSLDLYKYSIRQ